jgi:NAD-dependent histone deacetylase SIR2
MQKAIHEKTVPHCLNESCNGLVKPEIVFFGEQLPSEFFDNRHLPAEADLCIIMGTSLSVQPFASLPQFCLDRTPRVLINQDQVGGLGSRPDDVLLLGDCDAGVRKLAEALGWTGELEEMWAKTAPEGQLQVAKKEPKKSRDEILQDEVDLITREVERDLKLVEAQTNWLESHVDSKFAKIQEKDDKPTSTESSTTEASPAEPARSKSQTAATTPAEPSAVKPVQADRSPAEQPELVTSGPAAAEQSQKEPSAQPQATSGHDGKQPEPVAASGLAHVFPFLSPMSSV